jgi:hypothetical protein
MLENNVGQDGILRADWQSALVVATAFCRQDVPAQGPSIAHVASVDCFSRHRLGDVSHGWMC